MANIDTSFIQPLFTSSSTFTILLPQNPKYDHVASGLALKLSLEQNGKQVSIACPDPMTVEFNRLVGVESISTSLGGRNLVITFADQTNSVDKISYNVEQGELRLVITPKEDAPNLDHRRLQFVPATPKADTLILIGANGLTDFGRVYTDSQDHFTAPNVISLTHIAPASQFAHYHMSDATSSSLSEIVTHLLDAVSREIPDDAATNLLSGIEIATGDFKSPSVGAGTFDAAAILLRRGAKRHSPIKAADFPEGAIPQQDSTPGTAEAVQEFKSPPADWTGPKVYTPGPQLV